MVQLGPGARGGGAAPAGRARLVPQVVDRAARPAARLPGARCRGLRLRRRVWTTRRVAPVIERVVGVRYHPAYAGPLLVLWDGSPIHRAQAVRTSWRLAPPGACTWSRCRPTRPS